MMELLLHFMLGTLKILRTPTLLNSSVLLRESRKFTDTLKNTTAEYNLNPLNHNIVYKGHVSF